MIHILLLGKYVKPLIELIDLHTETITILKDGGYVGLIEWTCNKKALMKGHRITNQIIITKKEYQKLIALIPMVDSPIDAFVMIYGEYLNDSTYDTDRGEY